MIGEVAALATSVLWSFTAIFFSRAGRVVGAPVVNRSRLAFAVVLLGVTHRLLLGRWLPLDAEPYRWGWLALSGVVGLALGDAALFQAFVIMGPRLSMLMMATVPVLTTLAGRALFGEVLSRLETLGIALTLAGIGWVVTERRASSSDGSADRFWLGVTLGLLAALGQAAGVVTSRLGLEGDFPTVSGTLIRALAGGGLIWLAAVARGSAGRTVRAWARRDALPLLAAGSVVGPYLGVWLSLVAVQRAPVGIASTLMALPPVVLIGLEYLMFGTRVTRRAVAGTLLAFGGVGAIFYG